MTWNSWNSQNSLNSRLPGVGILGIGGIPRILGFQDSGIPGNFEGTKKKIEVHRLLFFAKSV